MPSSLNADNGVVSGTAGLKSSADSSGVLDLQTNGTTAISISASQVVSFANQPTYTGGTANGVMFLNGSKAVTTGTALTFDGTNFGTTGNANLGSGSKSTDTQLNFLADTGTQRIYIDRGGRDLVFLDVSASLEAYRIRGITGVQSWGVGGSEQMRLNSTGLGIGTSSPQGRLEVNGVAYFTRGTKSCLINANYGVSDQFTQFQTATGMALAFATNGDTERARISAAGNFGIGTNSPLVALHVVGSGNANSIMTNQFARLSSASNAINFGDDGTDGLIGVGNSSSNLSLLARVAGVYSKALTVNSNSTITTAATISVGNATPTTSGAGITFPATQAASSNANTLDDYEEGSWSPVLAGIGSGTINQQFGAYTKIGNLVFVTGKLGWTGKTGTDALSITGLPFNAADASDSASRSSCLPEGDWQNVNDLMDLNGMFRINGTSLQGVIDNGSGSSIIMTAANVSAAGEFNFSLTYRASA